MGSSWSWHRALDGTCWVNDWSKGLGPVGRLLLRTLRFIGGSRHLPPATQSLQVLYSLQVPTHPPGMERQQPRVGEPGSDMEGSQMFWEAQLDRGKEEPARGVLGPRQSLELRG